MADEPVDLDSQRGMAAEASQREAQFMRLPLASKRAATASYGSEFKTCAFRW
jgi:hypothetical protein